MKIIISTLLLVFCLSYNAYGYKVFGGENAATLDGQSGAYYLDLANHTGNLPTSSFQNVTAESIVLTGPDGFSNAGQVSFSNATTVFNDYSALSSQYIVFGNASTTSLSIYLDNIANYRDGQQLRISKTDNTINPVTIIPASGETINGESSVVFASLGDALTLHANGGLIWKVLQRAVATEEGSALLHFDNEAGIFYALSTVFNPITSFDSALTSTTVFANLSTQTIDINEAGRFDIFTHALGEGLSGTLIEVASFLNFTSEIDEAGIVVPAGAQHFPTFVNVSVGSIVSGTVADLTSADGNTLVLDEVNSATPGAVYIFKFENIIAPKSFHWVESAYDGTVGHNVKIRVLNDIFQTFTSLTANATDLPNTGSSLSDVYTRDFNFHDPFINFVNAAGEVFVMVEHESTGSPGDQFLIDKLFVEDAFSTVNPTTATFYDLNVGDKISVKIKDGVGGQFKIRHSGIKIHKIGESD